LRRASRSLSIEFRRHAPRSPDKSHLQIVLQIHSPRTGKDGMRVRIDKARQHYSPTGINDLALVIDPLFDFRACANRSDVTITDQHRAVFDYRKLTQLRADSRTSRPGESYKL